MSRSKYPAKWRIGIVKKYLSGEGSYVALATKYGIGASSLRRWVLRYSKQGEKHFYRNDRNNRYSKELKTKCVEAVLGGEGSAEDIAVKYDVSSASLLENWIKCYNANIEFKDYETKREVYMAIARRKATLEERKEIAEYCISHSNDYKGTAINFDVSYGQVYSWVQKYRERGEDGLIDKRGLHKRDEEVDELERLRRENKRLKKQIEERDMLCELLKKVRELEGM